MIKRWIPVCAGLAMLAAACTSTSPGTVQQGSVSGASGQPGSPSAAPANKQLQFGQEYTKDNITFSLGVPEPFSPSTTAVTSSKLPRAVRLAFKLTNNTDKPLPPMGITIQGTAASQQLEQIFDHAQEVGKTPTADILPGKSITWTVGFGVPPDPTELTVQVSPSLSFSDNKVYYVGKV